MKLQHFPVVFWVLFSLSSCQLNNSKSTDSTGGSDVVQDIGNGEVHVIYTNNAYQLYRGASPYYICGAGGTDNPGILTNHGGNSIRTWGTDGAQTVLDNAQSYGLTVTLGMWVMPERQGFNYDNAVAVANQFTNFRNIVLQYRNHSALLLWGIGNELNLNYSNKKVWNAVQDIAKMIHELDTNHLTMTVLSGADDAAIKEIISRAPDIDLLGINVYGGIETVRNTLKAAGWKKPYIITEWGPNGYWEVQQTTWDAQIEQTGADKASTYQSRYLSISGNKDICLGSYVFYWSQKQERTPTWFSMFLEKIPALGINGESAETVDVMQYSWTGNWPANRAPHVSALKINNHSANESVTVPSGSANSAIVTVSDPDSDTLSYIWEFLKESTAGSTGGDAETRPDSVTGLITLNSGSQINFNAPATAGNYRLFIYVLDGKGHAGTANIPFKVQ